MIPKGITVYAITFECFLMIGYNLFMAGKATGGSPSCAHGYKIHWDICCLYFMYENKP